MMSYYSISYYVILYNVAISFVGVLPAAAAFEAVALYCIS